jgi:mRNA interferase HigB
MHVISIKKLRDFWARYPEAEQWLREWFRAVERADWSSPFQVREAFSNASIVGPDRIVFRVRGNRYRIVVRVSYPSRTAFVRFVGTHAEYDRIDAAEV